MKTVTSVISSVIGKQVGPDDGLGNTQGWDSMASLHILLALEAAYELKFDLLEVMEVKTVLDWEKAVNAKLTEK